VTATRAHGELPAANAPAPVLRDYQLAAVEACERAADAGRRRVLVALPTGTGKTAVFCGLIRRRGGRALVVAHREELLDQAAARLVESGIAAAAIGRVQATRDETAAEVVVASIATLARPARLARLVASQATAGPFRTVVVDEAHHAPAGSYVRALDALAPDGAADGPLVVGVTATARRKGLHAIFGPPVFSRDLVEMIAAGWLSDLRGRRVRLSLDLSGVRRSRGDFVEADLVEALAEAKAPEAVADAWCKEGGGRPTLVFTPGVGLAHATAGALVSRGVAAEAIDGTAAGEDRAATLARFAAGATTVLVNCALFTEGVDLPHVACVVVARPTLSPLLYAQMVGRGTRLAPGKADCLVLDVVGATDRHDLANLDAAERPQHLGTLAGLRLTRSGSVLRAAMADQERRRRLVELYGAHGLVLADDVALFGRGRFRWLTIPGDGSPSYVLGLGKRGYAIVSPEGDGTWRVDRAGGGERFEGARHLTLTAATAFAERWAREYKATALASVGAPWRKRPPSPRAIGYLLSLSPGLSETDLRRLSAGDVSDLIDAAKVTRLLRGAA
jgi:superfamily II DNA or RNA helicase